jgi:hypothetical protein
VSRYRKVDPRIWNDKKFRSLTDQGKLVFLLLLTHPGMTALGAMRGTPEGLAAEIHWKPEVFVEAFQKVLFQGMAKHDPEASLIVLPNFLRYNRPESPNVVKAWVGAVDLLPECDLKTEVITSARDIAEGMSDGFKQAFVGAFGNG